VAKSTLDTLNEFLDGTAPLSQPQGQEKAFACLVVLLNVAATENLELAKLTLERCIHHSRRLWHAKAHDSLKDQILAILSLGAPFLETLVAEDDDMRQTSGELNLLLDVFTIEYCKRQERELLQQEDFDLCENWRDGPAYPFVLPSVRIRPGVRRVEHTAAILLTIARLHRVLSYPDSEPNGSYGRIPDLENRPRKRQKKARPLEAVLSGVAQAKNVEQVARIQVLTFLAAGVRFSGEVLEEFVEFASGLVSHESNAASAWAMMTVAL
jgi:hypothetical protein